VRKSDLRDLKRFELLAELGETDREILAQELVVREMEPGTRLFERGDTAESLLFIMEGCVKIWRVVGGEFVELRGGACIGALALTGGTQREICAETGELTKVFELPLKGFEHLVVSEPRTACRLLQVILRDQTALFIEAAEALEAVSPSVDSTD
jgi:CRP-like cAMP-binding protein